MNKKNNIKNVICSYYMNGYYKYGNNCRYLHLEKSITKKGIVCMEIIVILNI